MTIRYKCTECEAGLRIKDELAGTKGRCPKCGTRFVVPAVKAAADAAAPAAPTKALPPAAQAPVEDDDPMAVLFQPMDEQEQSAQLLRTGGVFVPDDDDEDEMIDVPVVKTRRPEQSSDATASGNAADLLARTAEEKRKSPELQSQPEESRDIGPAVRELFLILLPGLVGIFIVTLGAYQLFTDALRTKPIVPELGTVTGTVTIDGKAAPNIEVLFNPLGLKYQRYRPSIAVTDKNGRYDLNYIEDHMGAVVGSHKVELRSVTRALKIPVQYNAHSEITRVVAAGDNRFNIDLKLPRRKTRR